MPTKRLNGGRVVPALLCTILAGGAGLMGLGPYPKAAPYLWGVTALAGLAAAWLWWRALDHD